MQQQFQPQFPQQYQRAVRPRTGSAFGIVVLWHLAAVVAFVVWVLTWPEQVGSQYLSMPRGLMALLLGILLVGPALAVSLCIASLMLLAVRRVRSALLAGTVAAYTGFALVAGGLALYSLLKN